MPQCTVSTLSPTGDSPRVDHTWPCSQPSIKEHSKVSPAPPAGSLGEESQVGLPSNDILVLVLLHPQFSAASPCAPATAATPQHLPACASLAVKQDRLSKSPSNSNTPSPSTTAPNKLHRALGSRFQEVTQTSCKGQKSSLETPRLFLKDVKKPFPRHTAPQPQAPCHCSAHPLQGIWFPPGARAPGLLPLGSCSTFSWQSSL